MKKNCGETADHYVPIRRAISKMKSVLLAVSKFTILAVLAVTFLSTPILVTMCLNNHKATVLAELISGLQHPDTDVKVTSFRGIVPSLQCGYSCTVVAGEIYRTTTSAASTRSFYRKMQGKSGGWIRVSPPYDLGLCELSGGSPVIIAYRSDLSDPDDLAFAREALGPAASWFFDKRNTDSYCVLHCYVGDQDGLDPRCW